MSVRATPKAFLITPEQIELRELKKNYNELKWKRNIKKLSMCETPSESQKLPGKAGSLI